MPLALGPSSESLQGRNPREVEADGRRGRYLWGFDDREDEAAKRLGVWAF
jgi:hypothetical protein